MNAMILYAEILLVTIATGVAAMVLDWLMLRAAFRLMQPAGARRPRAALVMARSGRPVIAHR